MMASRILSRFLPNADDGSYQQSYGHDHGPTSDRAERGLRDSSDEHELNALLAQVDDEADLDFDPRQGTSSRPHGDEDIPASLLMEDKPDQSSFAPSPSRRAESQWKRAQERQQLHPDDRPLRVAPHAPNPNVVLREQAMWFWTNVQNLDAFLLQVYQYFTGHGIWSILLSRCLHLATTAFLFSLFIFLSTCVDYTKIPTSKSSSEVLIPQCMKNSSWTKSLLLWVFCFWWLWTLFTFLADIPRLRKMEMFYQHLLGIPDTDIQAVSWERVVQGLMKLRDLNPETAAEVPKYLKAAGKQSKQRMDAHDIANRLMRQDNYSIALFNKEIIDLTLSVPFLGNRQYYSRSLENCINFCFNDFIFDEQGQVKTACLQRKDRSRLIQALRTRLRFVAILSIFLAPFTITLNSIYYFSRYYAEFRASPSAIGARTFTPLAEWKFREFNELDHDFRHRIKQAHPMAAAYLDQFPRDKTHQFLQFVSLVSGTLAGLLTIATLWDSELFLGFEITPGRTAFFYVSILLAIATGARSAIPDESKVHEPIFHLMNVIDATHYCPARWKKQLHSDEVRVEFSALYQMKVMIFLEEILSLLIAPFILWRNSGKRSEMIIDFFRNSTVQVDGLGHLCTFAVFEFRKSKNVEDDVDKDVDGLREEYFGTKDDKMAMSQYYFMERLGKYDRQQAARHNRPHGIQLPPAFPPLETPATMRGRNVREPSSHQPSPHQSLLLDVPRQKAGSAPYRKAGGQRLAQLRAGGKRHNPADYLSPNEGEEDHIAGLDAMTTSRLIEQDNNLSDSWKAFGERADMEDLEVANERRPNNGVLGLLVEYSKAHAGGKGPKIG
ncbi:APG9-domain-containing protein [Aureobasidium pullulans]|nr:APG9-domain-containing protein [Aureobasidium pullulans]THY03442.1 APG9-domain-containing protein [Aureobasidium pullulans]